MENAEPEEEPPKDKDTPVSEGEDILFLGIEVCRRVFLLLYFYRVCSVCFLGAIIMLNQASTDRIELAKLLNISDLQMSYIISRKKSR